MEDKNRTPRRDRRQRNKRIAISAMLSALGVIVLYIGALVDVLDVSTAVLAALLIVPVVLEYGGWYPLGIWGVTSVLSLAILPQKMPAVIYGIFGYYPALKVVLERLPRPLSWIMKELIFLTVEFLVIRASDLILGSEQMPLWYHLSLYAVGLLALNLTDLLLTRLSRLYNVKYRDRIGKWMR